MISRFFIDRPIFAAVISIVIVIAGGVIPPQDYEFLKEHGASLIFGPGTLIPVAAVRILKELNERLGYA